MTMSMPSGRASAALSIDVRGAEVAYRACGSDIRCRVLVVDDSSESRDRWRYDLGQIGCEVEQAGGAADALTVMCDRPPDLILTDLRMDRPDDGLLLAYVVRARWPQVPIVLYTALASEDDGLLAAELGLRVFEPADPDPVLPAIQSALKGRRQLGRTVSEGPRPIAVRWPRPIAMSWAMQQTMDMAARASKGGLPIVITGETGVGKELIARAIHRWSPRAKGPFVALNCGAIPEQLLESEVFGHRKGAFTGADSDKPGLVDGASGGTLFLDEIGDLPPRLQVVLLRFLESGEYRRVGDPVLRKADVRVVSATNRSLTESIDIREFREDSVLSNRRRCCARTTAQAARRGHRGLRPRVVGAPCRGLWTACHSCTRGRLAPEGRALARKFSSAPVRLGARRHRVRRRRDLPADCGRRGRAGRALCRFESADP